MIFFILPALFISRFIECVIVGVIAGLTRNLLKITRLRVKPYSHQVKDVIRIHSECYILRERKVRSFMRITPSKRSATRGVSFTISKV